MTESGWVDVRPHHEGDSGDVEPEFSDSLERQKWIFVVDELTPTCSGKWSVLLRFGAPEDVLGVAEKSGVFLNKDTRMRSLHDYSNRIYVRHVEAR